MRPVTTKSAVALFIDLLTVAIVISVIARYQHDIHQARERTSA